jgi:hypothetical protein
VVTAVDTSPVFPPDFFAPPRGVKPESLDEGGGELLPITLNSRPPARFWAAPKPPPGFQEKGRYQFGRGTPSEIQGLPASLAMSIMDVYTDGPNLVVVAQGNTADISGEFQPDSLAQNISGGQLPGAQAIPDPFGNLVRSQTDSVRYVRVLGTIPLRQLEAFADTLRSAPKGQITFITTTTVVGA